MKKNRTNRKTKPGPWTELIVRVICLAVILVLTGRYAAAEELPAEGLLAEKLPAEEVPEEEEAEEQPEEELSGEEPQAGGSPEELPAEELPAEELPTEEQPVEVPPAEEPSAEEPSAEDPPSEEPPAEDPPAEGAGGQSEKTEVAIVLRPVKEEGEPDPDLTEEIRNRIVSQIVGIEQDCLDRLCSCVTWEYDYSGGLAPPGTDRPAGESDIRLIFSEDPEFSFRGWTGISGETDTESGGPEGEKDTEEGSEPEDLRSYLTTLPGKQHDGNNEEGTGPEAPEEGTGQEGTENGTGPDESTAEPETAEDTEPEMPEADGAGAEAAVPEPGPAAPEQNGTAVPSIPVQTIIPIEPVSAAALYTGTTAVMTSEPAVVQNGLTSVRNSSEKDSLVSVRGRADTTVRRKEKETKTEAKTEFRLIRTDQDRELDLTDRYPEILTSGNPETTDWRTVMDPVPENDGRYVLRVKKTDRRGTVTTKNMTFSVNRFGSVYSYNSMIRSLRGKTVRNVKDPLVISEYNPDPLEPESWNLSLTHDGQAMDQVLYTVNRGTEGKGAESSERLSGTAGWYRYDYVISPENFREDGVYRIMVSSRDSAGNRPETNRYNGGDIVFTVDSTPPELQLVEGLEEPVVRGETAEVRITAFDAVGLAGAAVYADGRCLGEMKQFADRHRAEMTVHVSEGENQKIRVVLTDTAGNRLDTEEKTEGGEYLFRPAFPFRRNVSVIPEKENTTLKKDLFALAAAILSCTAAAVLLFRKFFREEDTPTSDG